MDEQPAERDRTAESAGRPVRPASLSAAIRAARVEVADRAQALGDLRDAELARLELLREMLEPVLAEVPSEVDLFDTGLVPGEHPRLFIDMVAFVDMGRDRRTYRLMEDRRHVRAVLHEGEGVTAAVAAVTAYIAPPPRRARTAAGLPRPHPPGAPARRCAARPAPAAIAGDPPHGAPRRGRARRGDPGGAALARVPLRPRPVAELVIATEAWNRSRHREGCP